MKENKEETTEKMDETFFILFEELTTSLVMSVQSFFKKFEHTLKNRTDLTDVLGILFSCHFSSLNFWIQKIGILSGSEELKNKLEELMVSIENTIGPNSDIKVIKNRK